MTPPKRSLLLAGGGMKVAFQAGVLQVLLSERGLAFDHYDACSGGAFNLALLCAGRSGVEIADTWRRTRPVDGVSGRWQDLVRVPWGERSLVTMDNYRRVFRIWGLHWDRIRASTLDATFTVHNRTRGERQVFAPAEMDEDRLVACLSQAVWFPPVEIDGMLYTDAVFDTDANVDAALDRGADEIWVIWTVSRRPEWMPGLMAQFFHALEESANGTLQADLERIRRNNEDRAAGRHGAFGRHVEVRLIQAEVPLHYLVLLGGDRLHRAVEQGVAEARRWCDEQRACGVDIPAGERIDRGDFYNSAVTLTFADHARGYVDSVVMDADLRLIVPDAGEFVSAGRQRGELGGTVTWEPAGGVAEVVGGHADILIDEPGDPARKHMEYVVQLATPDHRHLTLIGVKSVATPTVRGAVGEAMRLTVDVYEGHHDERPPAPAIANGTLFMGLRDVLNQVRTADAEGPHTLAEWGGLARYTAFFVGKMWDVAARRWLTYSPF